MDYPIYLDHAATTAVVPEVVEAMLPYFTEYYGNPATLYSVGMAAREAVENARESVATMLNASPEEIVFTSGGTESDNAAIHAAVQADRSRRHLLTLPIEHHAVLEPLETLAHQGYDLEILPVDSEGLVSPAELAKRIRPDTALVSIMHANNEIGTVQQIAVIGAICRAHGVLFHTDAVQTFGKLPLDVRTMQIDMLSLTAHKFYGPKGCGALYVRRGIRFEKFMEGGQQEKGRRAGTLNVPGIVGLGKATDLARATMSEEGARLTELRDYLMAQLESRIPGVRINGSRTQRLPNNVSICVEGVEGEPMLLALDAAGICAAAGSACSSGSTEPSHVLKAIGVPRESARGALRLTLGRTTTYEALDYTVQTLASVVRNLRGLNRREPSPASVA
jgi:cysteine desulfurase